MNKRKIFSTIMVIVMLVALLPAMALAQVTEVKQAPSYFEQLSNWKISPSVPGTTCGLPGGADADISKPDYNTSGWVDAVAPSTVLGNLIDAGVYDEFFMDRSGTTDEWYNRQFTSIRSADFDEPWWYSTDFALPASEAGKRVTIAIGGMTYMADFYVNGVQVFNELTNINDKYDLWNGPPVYGLAQGDANDYTDITNVGSNRAAQFGTLDLDSYRNLIVGSFRRFDIDITDYLNPVGTSNNLKFKITKPISQQDLTYHWVDWHPRPVDSMMGLTGVVSIGTSGPVRLNNPAVSTVVSDDLNTAAVTLYCDATNLTDAAVTGTVTAVVNDPDGLTVAIVQKNVTIPSKVYNVEMIFRPADFPALNMSDPKLWYPAGSGDQPLYNINWSFTYDGAISDALTHRAGLRQLSYEINVTPLGNQNRATVTSNAGANMAQFYFNHKPVLLKGGGYCPTDLFLRHDPVKNQGVIDNMLYSGLNMFRDEGKFFDNDLLDLCDENGIVVMTGWCCCDRHQSPNSWSKCERFWGYEEQYAQTKNLRQHACGGLWFNGSDQPASFSQSSRSNSWMVEEMYHMIEAKCRWDVIGATAPSSCLDSSKLLGNINGGFHMDSTYENNATTYFYSPWGAQLNGEGPFGFISEGLGGSNIPSIESLKKIIARDNIFPYNATSYADFSAWSTHSNIIALVTLAENAYGASTSLESWHAKATAQCYDQYRAQYEAINYFRFKNNTGLVNWMLNSARPNMYWSEFDFYMNPTAATFGIAKANEPLHIMYNPYDKDISVINGTFNAYPGMTAEVSIYNLDGKLINKPLVKTFDVAPDGASPTTVYGTMANYTSTNAQALKWAVKEADGRTSFRNGWHYDEVTGAFTPMNYNYFGQIKDAYGVNILWGYDDIEASLTAPMSDVYFLRLDLKDSAGNVASTNSYAVPYRGDITAATGWMYGAPVAVGDLSALNSLPALSASELTCTQTGSAVVGENVVQTVVVSNNSPYVAHNVLLAAYPDNTLTDLIGAVQFTDNMFILLPGESRTIDVTHRKSNLAGDAVITMTCYNNQVSGDKPVRFKNVYTGLGIGQGRSLSNGK
ncbi:MAG: hypothetical protein FWG53_01580, partial [Clostridiales bacterium]|nr:hypothetical protein [Clostridiales bacterium]